MLQYILFNHYAKFFKIYQMKFSSLNFHLEFIEFSGEKYSFFPNSRKKNQFSFFKETVLIKLCHILLLGKSVRV